MRSQSLTRWKARKARRAFSFSFIVLFVLLFWTLRPTSDDPTPIGPLTEQHVQGGEGVGGSWYLPPSWLHEQDVLHSQRSLMANASVLDAAEHALGLALRQGSFLDHSQIPLIVHQTWRTLDAATWPGIIRESVEKWLLAAAGDAAAGQPEMAWFLWDDDGIDALMKKYEPDMYDDFRRLPYPVEKADMFRVVVLKWLGGVYADVDSKPLKHPSEWIFDADLSDWTDDSANSSHGPHDTSAQAYRVPDNVSPSYRDLFQVQPGDAIRSSLQQSVNAIFGIEADNRPAPDPTYWRMGYSYPIQLTNWALAMAPHHPVANQFLSTLSTNITQHRTNLRGVDPLDITGPPALTAAVRAVAQQDDPSLSWDALSARNGDVKGGRGKIVAGDALILPITGFSPGRGWFQNMGSQSTSHRNARLHHEAAGSWRKMDVKVHYGKLCRQLFGMCREWKKIPDV